MRIAVMADIHSNHIALETCFAEAQRRNAEIFIFLGDYLGDLAYPQKTLEYLDGIKKKYPCIFIRGNKEDYWINHKNGKHRDWVWEAGRSGSGMLAYVYNHLTLEQIENFEKMPISMTMRYQGFPDFVICHGSPWKTNESMREDYDYIDELTKRLETELTICAHFHIQSKYTRNGKLVINPGAVGVPLRSNGQAQFMMLEGISGKWETEFITLQYDRERAIQEMDEEKLSEQAPGWCRITKEVLRHGQATHLMTLMKAQELYEQHTGINDWKNIPEEYWNMALEEMKVPE
jgi:putative phosphoesterase